MAGRNIKGITVEIGGDTTKLQTALEGVNSKIKNTQAQLRDVEKLLKLDPGNTELLAQKHKLLADAVSETKSKLETLETAAKQANDALAKGEISQEQHDALQREIVETKEELERLETAANQSATAVQKIAAEGEKLKNIGDNISGVGEKFLPATAAVVGLGAAAVKTAADFDTGMSKVAAISGATGDDLDALRAKAREMGAKTKFSASEAASAMEYMAMAGWKTEDMLGGIEGIMNLAAASGEDLATTSDIVTDALTAFGMSAQESGYFADILAVASSNANTNVSMMGETFKYAAPVAGALGYTAEDTALAIGMMANAGIKSSQAGTAIRSGLTRLVKPTKQVREAMDKYGIGELNATFMDMGISRYQWQTLEISPSLGLRLADGSFEDIPLGVFTVSEAEWTASGIVVKAYDHMARFDKNYSGGNAKGKPYDLLSNACSKCGVTLGMTKAQVRALPNGTETLSVYSTDNVETWRDFIGWLSQAMGCFATMDRAGALVFRQYSQEPVDTLDTEHRFSGAAFSEYTTKYTGLSCVDLELQKTMYLNVTPDDGLTYNLGSNPFLQRGGGDVVARRRAVLEALLPIYYVPFRVTAIGNPAYDLGDCIRFTDGLADGSLSCITKYAFTFNQRYEMSGSGADPNLASAKSKSDKDISGLLSSVNDTAIQFYFFISVANVLVEDKRARMVIDLDYTAREGASVVFHGEIKHKITLTPEPEPEPPEGETPTIKIPKEATIAVTYYVNGDEVTEYYPVNMETAGTHLLHLQYFWDVAEDTLDGDFQVWIRMDGAKMDIVAGEARGYLMGQGLAADDLDKSLRYIYIATLPTTRDYLEGSNMDYTGLVVMAMYKDGTTEDITSQVTLSPENGAKLETVGEVPCVVTYTDEDGNAYRDGFSVTVTPKVLESIVITSPPTKLDYVLGQPYDYSGLEVTAFYNNNTSEVVTDRCTITPAEGSDTDAAGEIPVLVSFTKDDVTQTATFNVNVLVLDYIEIVSPPDTTEYTEDDPYDYTGIEVVAHFEDGTTWDITEECTFDPASGSPATMGTDTVTVTYAPSAVSRATATFPITVKEKPKVKVRAIELLATTYEESLARIKSVLSIPNKMLQRIEAKRSSVFSGASLNIVLAAGYCNYKGSGSTRYVLMDISPWIGTGKYLYEFYDPATGLSQGIQIPSDYPSYREFYPHQYMWENCSGNNFFFIVGYEGELQQDEAYTTPFLSDLILDFGSDVYNYNPFSQTGKQSYQALAANCRIIEVEKPDN